MSPGHSNPSYFCKIHFNITPYLRLGLPNDVFPSGVPTKNIPWIPLLSNSCYPPGPFHPPWIGHSNHIWRRVQVTKFILQFSPTFYYFILFDPNIRLSTLFSNILSLFLRSCQKQSFTPIRSIYVYVYTMYTWNHNVQCDWILTGMIYGIFI
jgi:hypothetical protein